MRACTYCRRVLSSSETTCPEDGGPTTEVVFAAPDAELQRRFGELTPFAYGATGSLFVSRRTAGAAPRLLKVLHEDVGASLAERTRYHRELRKQTAISHPSLVRVLEEGESGGRLWLLREFVPGETLGVTLKRRGAWPLTDALAIVAQVATALDELHRQGLVHRDVKPGHVVVIVQPGAPPRLRLLDAGVAARLPGSAIFEACGTPTYAAPELIAGRPASFRSDLYALGCLFYELLAGAPPFIGDSDEAVLAAHGKQTPKALEVDLPAPVRAVLDALLSKEPRRRPFSAQQVRRALDPYLPAGMPDLIAVSRSSTAPTPASRADPSARSSKSSSPPPKPADATLELTPEDLDAAEAAAGETVRTEELELSDIEPVSPQAPPDPTQELELADIASVRPPSAARTQELELTDLEPVVAASPSAARPSSSPAALHQDRAHSAATAGSGARARAARSDDSQPTTAFRSDRPPPSGAASTDAQASDADEQPTMAFRSDRPAPAAASKPEPIPPAGGHAATGFDVEKLFDDAVGAAGGAAKQGAMGGTRAHEPAQPAGIEASPPPSAGALGTHDERAEAAAPSPPTAAAQESTPPPRAAGASGAQAAAAPKAARAAGEQVTAAPKATAASGAQAAAGPKVASAAGERVATAPKATGASGAEAVAAPKAAGAAEKQVATAPKADSAVGEVATPLRAASTAAQEVAATAPKAQRAAGEAASPPRAESAVGEALATPPKVGSASAAAEAEAPPSTAERSSDPAFGSSQGSDSASPPAGASAQAASAPARHPLDPTVEPVVGRRRAHGGKARPWPLLLAAAVLIVLAIGIKLARRDGGRTIEPSAVRPEATPTSTATARDSEPTMGNPASSGPGQVEPQAAPGPPHADGVAVVASQRDAGAAPGAAPASDKPVDAGGQEQVARDAAAPEKAPAEGSGKTLSAAEAGKAYLHDAGVTRLGGVVAYRPRSRPEIDYKIRARQYYQAGKYREAAEAYRRATLKAPSDAGAFAGLGASWLSAGEPDRAIVAYQRAVQLKPKVSGFQAALGRAYLNKGDRGRALAAYTKALELDPNNQAAKYGLARLKPAR